MVTRRREAGSSGYLNEYMAIPEDSRESQRLLEPNMGTVPLQPFHGDSVVQSYSVRIPTAILFD